MFLLLLTWTHETKLHSEAGILRLWEIPVLVISGMGIDTVGFSFSCYRPGEPVSVLGRCTSTYYLTDKIERPEHGSRLRTGLIGWDFKDPGACLHHYTTG